MLFLGFTRQFWLEYFYSHIPQAWPSYQNIITLAWAKYSTWNDWFNIITLDARTPKQTCTYPSLA